MLRRNPSPPLSLRGPPHLLSQPPPPVSDPSLLVLDADLAVPQRQRADLGARRAVHALAAGDDLEARPAPVAVVVEVGFDERVAEPRPEVDARAALADRGRGPPVHHPPAHVAEHQLVVADLGLAEAHVRLVDLRQVLVVRDPRVGALYVAQAGGACFRLCFFLRFDFFHGGR